MRGISRIGIGLIGIAISIYFVLNLEKLYDAQELLSIYIKVGPSTLISCIILYLSTFIFRAYRWKLMITGLTKTSITTITQAIIIGFGVNNLLPMRLGEIARAWFISKETNLAKSTALTSVLVEKVIDAAVIFFFVIVSLRYLGNTDEEFTRALYYITIIFGFAIVSIITTTLFDKKILNYWGKFSYKFNKSIQNIPINILGALSFLKSPSILLILLLSLFIWVIEGFIFVLVLNSISVKNPISLGFLTLGTVNMSILIPSAPGYLGVFQAGVMAGLSFQNIVTNTALSIAIFIHLIQYVPVTILTIILLINKGANAYRYK